MINMYREMGNQSRRENMLIEILRPGKSTLATLKDTLRQCRRCCWQSSRYRWRWWEDGWSWGAVLCCANILVFRQSRSERCLGSKDSWNHSSRSSYSPYFRCQCPSKISCISFLKYNISNPKCCFNYPVFILNFQSEAGGYENLY